MTRPDGIRRSRLAIAGLIFPFAFAALAAQTVGDRLPPWQPAQWKAGVAAVVITPDRPMWMSGSATRKAPSEGKVHDLHAKALALEDAQGAMLVIVTVDLLGITRELRDWLEQEVHRRYDLPPARLMINASHTHCGPVLHKSTASIYGHSFYGLTQEQMNQAREYTDELQDKLAGLVGAALDRLVPAHLTYTHARAGFAMNRRTPSEDGYRNAPNPDGPVDHDVPILRVDAPQGELRAVLFGYACHNTTLSFNQFCGDYAGFAQRYLEEAHPGATALFLAGCGGDQNPYPRRTLALAQQHGRALANGVETALLTQGQAVQGPVQAALETVSLDFAKPPSRQQLQREAGSDNKYERQHAQVLLRELDQTGQLRTTYPYLVQVLQFGGDLTLVALAGEVVVDYALRLKNELPGPAVWVAGFSNDVFGYVPSLRVLREGGYEGGDAMRYTELPGPFAPSVEERIVDMVHRLVDEARAPRSD